MADPPDMADLPADAARTDALETLVAHQQRTIEELSDALAAQWRDLEALRRDVRRLTESVADLEEGRTTAVPVEKPPHW